MVRSLKYSYTNTGTTFQGIKISVDDTASGTDYYEIYVAQTGTAVVTSGLMFAFFCGHVIGGPKGDTGPSGGGLLARRYSPRAAPTRQPLGMRNCIIECVGGGGGRTVVAGSGNMSYITGGGGAGGYSRKYATAANIGASQAVTIGGGWHGWWL